MKYRLKKEERKQEEEEKAKNKEKNSDDVDLGEEAEMIKIDNELGEEVEKEMKKNKKDDEIPEDEETKVELNEDNQEILNKIKELKKFEKKWNLPILWMLIGRKKPKKIKNQKNCPENKSYYQWTQLRHLILLNFSIINP